MASPSQWGKSEWAKSLGRYILWTGAPTPRDDWDDTADFLIMEDMDKPTQEGMWMSLMGGQRIALLRDLHFRKRKIWGKPAIFLCNQLPDMTEWDFANTTTIVLDNKLY